MGILWYDTVLPTKGGMLADGPSNTNFTYEYKFVPKEEIAASVMLGAVVAVNATNAAEAIQRWCTTLGVPPLLASDTATHVKNTLLHD